MRRLLLALGLLALFGGSASAQIACGPLPYVFSNGTLADATQVNADFNTIVTCLTGATTVTVAGGPTSNHVASFQSGTVLQDAGFTAYHDSHNNFGVGGTTFGAGITTGGIQNTADGDAALLACTTCNLNTANGFQAATNRTTGRAGTYTGWNAGRNDTTGASDTFTGAFAGYGHFYADVALTGTGNTGTGEAALLSIQGAASWNTTDGYASGFNCTTCSYNNLYGLDAGESISTQTDNNVMGANAYAYAQGSYNIALGTGAGAGYVIGQPITTDSTGTTLLMSNTTGFVNGNQIFTSLTPVGTTITGVNPGVSVTISAALTNTLIAGSFVYDIPSPYLGGENIFEGVDAGNQISGAPTHAVGIGQQALLNLGTGGDDDIGIGYRSLVGDGLGGTTGSAARAIGIGSHALEHFLQTDTVAVGYNAGNLGASFAQSALVGSQACPNITSSSGNLTCLGYLTGASVKTAASVILLGSGVDDTGDANNYMNLGNIITTTGTNVPSTSITTIAGNLLMPPGNYIAWGTTAAYPRLERDATGTDLDLVLGNNSGYTTLHVAGLAIGTSTPGASCPAGISATTGRSVNGVITAC